MLAAAVAGGLLVLLARVGRALGRSRRYTHRHADVARLVGDVDQALGAVIVDAPDPVVYAVAGRPATIVVSRAALDVLDGPQLRAVLTHERAHLAGRHHLLLAVTQALATAMPRIRLFTTGSTELGRLVEMCADDAAVRGHGNRVVVGALLALVESAALPRTPARRSRPIRPVGRRGRALPRRTGHRRPRSGAGRQTGTAQRLGVLVPNVP